MLAITRFIKRNTVGFVLGAAVPVVVVKLCVLPVQQGALNADKQELEHLRNQLTSMKFDVKLLEQLAKRDGRD